MRPRKGKSTVSFVGSGQVATTLAYLLRNAGISIRGYHNKSQKRSKIFESVSNAEWLSLEEIAEEKNIIIIAIPDDALHVVCKKIKSEAMVIHTSGAVSIDVLKQTSLSTGVLYPLRSFTYSLPDSTENIPFFIEANSSKNLSKIKEIAEFISPDVHVADSDKRLHLHLAAVFAHNFTNHILHIAEKIMQKNGLAFSQILPLLLPYFKLLKTIPPSHLQTGPALREDKKTQKRHKDILRDSPEWRELYKLISEDIQRLKIKKPTRDQLTKFRK